MQVGLCGKGGWWQCERCVHTRAGPCSGINELKHQWYGCCNVASVVDTRRPAMAANERLRCCMLQLSQPLLRPRRPSLRLHTAAPCKCVGCVRQITHCLCRVARQPPPPPPVDTTTCWAVTRSEHACLFERVGGTLHSCLALCCSLSSRSPAGAPPGVWGEVPQPARCQHTGQCGVAAASAEAGALGSRRRQDRATAVSRHQPPPPTADTVGLLYLSR
jgi:hypothetical protein